MEDVMTHRPDRAIAVLDDAVVDTFGRYLSDQPLRRLENDPILGYQLLGWQLPLVGGGDADELGHILDQLPEDELVAPGDHRHRAHPEFEQLIAPSRVVEHVHRDKVNAIFRKKLFRPEAAASPGLGKEHELVRDHGLFVLRELDP